VIIKRRHIDEALTDDHDFTQNGYKALLKTLAHASRSVCLTAIQNSNTECGKLV